MTTYKFAPGATCDCGCGTELDRLHDRMWCDRCGRGPRLGLPVVGRRQDVLEGSWSGDVRCLRCLTTAPPEKVS